MEDVVEKEDDDDDDEEEEDVEGDNVVENEVGYDDVAGDTSKVEDDDVEDDEVNGEEDDDVEGMMLRRKTDPKTGKLTLCELAQSKST